MHWKNLALIIFGFVLACVAGYSWKEWIKYYKAKKNKNPDAEKLYTSIEIVILISIFALFELAGGFFF
jgi:hypothetical protein